MTAPVRQPKGVPVGGQFAEHDRADAETTLASLDARVLAEIPEAYVVFGVAVPDENGSATLAFDYIDVEGDEEGFFEVSDELRQMIADSWSPHDPGAWEQFDDAGRWMRHPGAPTPDMIHQEPQR